MGRPFQAEGSAYAKAVSMIMASVLKKHQGGGGMNADKARGIVAGDEFRDNETSGPCDSVGHF